MNDKPQKTEKPTGLALLREPFPAHQISKLPKPTKFQTDDVRQNYKNGIRCEICGGWHHPKVVHLDYVGHAALTDRLLDCDPAWNWEPVAVAEDGSPKFDAGGGLWINLTVCGVTRLGYGAAEGKSGGDAIKEIIGDGLRNAAMRFGAALDLWHKGDLHVAGDETPKDDLGAGAGMKDAWIDGIKDALPPDYSAQEFTDACAKQIVADMNKAKTAKGTLSAWDKRGDLIDWIAEKFPAIHQNLLDEHSAIIRGYEEEAEAREAAATEAAEETAA